jgi:hypothetical protein
MRGNMWAKVAALQRVVAGRLQQGPQLILCLILAGMHRALKWLQNVGCSSGAARRQLL